MTKKLLLVAISAACVAGQYAASLLGNVGLTTVAGTEKSGDMGENVYLPVGSDIYGPFEAGFSSAQDFILERLGCATGQGYLAGGIDTLTAESVVAKECGVTLPRWEGDDYVSLLGSCGGHTRQYHFHERFNCLYTDEGSHSTQVGKAMDGKFIYGMWENADSQELPLLDACGGHWGPTPDSDEDTYHYHVQDKAPFTVGCYGPNPDNSLVTVEQCRALYTTCGDGGLLSLDTEDGQVEYDPYCPCYDANGSNTGINIAPLPVFATDASQGPGGESVLQQPSGIDSSSVGEKKIKTVKKPVKKPVKKDPSGLRADKSECHGQQFEIRSKRGLCLDASRKRVRLTTCNGSADQLLIVKDGQIKNAEKQCLSSTLTFGPCKEESPHSFISVGTDHQIKLASGKCVFVKNADGLRVRKCDDKARQRQKFTFVPHFSTKTTEENNL